MDTEMHASTAAPDLSRTEPAECVEPEAPDDGPGASAARVVLVEDLEYFGQTGILRRVLELRWSR